MLTVDIGILLVERRDRFVRRRHDIAHLPNTVPSEQEILRIDVARLHEATGLLGAPARVRSIDESALVVHEVVKVASRTGQTLAKVFAADLEKLGGDRVAHLEDLPEDVDQALAAIETQEHPGRTGDPGFVDQHADIDRDARRIWWIEIGRVVESVTIAAEGHSLRFQTAALCVEHVVDDDAVEPRPKPAAPLERRQPSERLDDDLLRRVLG